MHVYSVVEEMKAVPVNTLNPQRTAIVVADFVKVGITVAHFHCSYTVSPCYLLIHSILNLQMGRISTPADLRYKEDLLYPGRLIEDAGNVKVGRPLHKVAKPSMFQRWKEIFPEEKFVLSLGNRWTDMVLEQNATGEDALRGWLVAAYASNTEQSFDDLNPSVLVQAYEKMESVFPQFLSELQSKGWHTDRFLDGTGSRFTF